MKLKMIGTGALSVKERSSCCLIDDKILVDCGNGIVKTLLEQGVNINGIDVLLVTHLHGDHFLDIPFLILQRTFVPAENKLQIFCPIGTKRTIEELVGLIYSDIASWKEICDKARVEFIEFENLQEDILDGYSIKSYKVIHGNCVPSFGYVISKNNKSIGVSGDSLYCSSIDAIINDSDLVVLDMSFVASSKAHMGVRDIELISEKYNKIMVATHMSEQARSYALQSNIKNLIVPNDGDEFNI